MSGLKYARAADKYHDKIRAERDALQSRIDRTLERVALVLSADTPEQRLFVVNTLRAALLGTEGE